MSAETLQLKVEAKAAMLMNAETGMILYAKNPHHLKYPADITQMATFLYALKKGLRGADEIVICPRHCLKRITPKKACDHQIKPGKKISLQELFNHMLHTSGHVAAHCIAHHVGGTTSQFVQGMNEYLKEIGCKNTHFLNPHGAYSPKHVTTAYDMAVVMREILKNRCAFDMGPMRCSTLFQEFVRSKNTPIQTGQFFYPNVLATKNGWHKSGNYTFVGVAEQKGRTLIAVLMDSTGSSQRDRDATRLFEAAFSEKERVRPLFNRKETLFERKGKQGQAEITALLDQDIFIRYYPSEEPSIRVELKWREKAPPIQKGELLGEVHILNENGTLIEKAPVYAAKEVQGRGGVVSILLKGGLAFLFFASTTSSVYCLVRYLKKKGPPM